MSQPVRALAPLPFELVYDDGEPLDSPWHCNQMILALNLISQAMEEQGRTDFFAGGNNFVYYSVEQAWEVAQEEEGGKKRTFRGPDVFWVGGVDPTRERQAWIAWEEEGRLPDFILELLSPKTAKNDRTVKKDLYAKVFGTSEYFLYDPRSRTLEGFRLAAPGLYRPLTPDAQGRLWSEQLGVVLGLWHGVWMRSEADWVRLFRPDGSLVPTSEEAEEAERQQKEAQRQRADLERQRADAERRRAELAEAEVARLRALLEERDPV
jgi:Uma2 family endonuclease